MCAAALSLVGVRHVFFGCRNDKFGGCGTVLSAEETACGPCGCAREVAGAARGGVVPVILPFARFLRPPGVDECPLPTTRPAPQG